MVTRSLLQVQTFARPSEKEKREWGQQEYRDACSKKGNLPRNPQKISNYMSLTRTLSRGHLAVGKLWNTALQLSVLVVPTNELLREKEWEVIRRQLKVPDKLTKYSGFAWDLVISLTSSLEDSVKLIPSPLLTMVSFSSSLWGIVSQMLKKNRKIEDN